MIVRLKGFTNDIVHLKSASNTLSPTHVLLDKIHVSSTLKAASIPLIHFL